MNLSNSYDWIVLGDHPGALLSANLAAKLGLSVLILPKSNTRKVIFSESGQCLDPESNFIAGMSEKGLLHEALRRASALPAEGELVGGGLTQILTPEARLELNQSLESSEAELERELKKGSKDRDLLEHGLKSTDEVLDYWQRFPAKLTLDMTQKTQKKAPQEAPAHWDDLLKKIQPKKSADLKSQLLSALAFGYSGQSAEGWSPAEWTHVVALGQSGSSFRGGLSAYRRMLLRSAKKLGATILEDVECRRIFIENGRFSGIQVSVSGNMITGTGCILGAGLGEFADLISYGGRRWARRGRKLMKPTGWRFTVALTVNQQAIVPGLSRRMIWKEHDAPIVEIEISDPSEYGTKELDQKLIFLRTILPFTQESLGIAHQRMVAARLFRVATEIIPFLERHVTRVYPDFRTAAAVEPGRADEFSKVYGFALPRMIPENLRVYDINQQKSSSGFEGFFISSSESFPKLGTLGPTIAAIEATAWVAHRSGLPGPL